MSILAFIAVTASLLTGSNCAIIDNTTNTTAVAVVGQPVWSSTYKDRGILWFDPAQGEPHEDAFEIHSAVVDALQIGEPGPKVRMACG